jgi:DNA helicase-2/ATP-dependent DNA helicase PcrA
VEFAAQESGYLAELEEERSVDAQGRIENIQELSGVAAELIAREPDAGLEGFLEQLSLLGEQDDYEEDDSQVTLMTLHIAKGLEFPVVFMVGMEDGVFPHFRSMTDAAQLEEERRLAYVGVTRARERLYLTNAWSRTLFGQSQYNPESRFLKEIPEHLLERREGEAASRRSRGAGGSAAGGAYRGGAQGGGHTVIGLPGREREMVPARDWSPTPAGVPKREVPAISAGDTVLHDTWGEGVVLDVSGDGDGAVAAVAFREVGEKRVLLAYAPLKKAGE